MRNRVAEDTSNDTNVRMNFVRYLNAFVSYVAKNIYNMNFLSLVLFLETFEMITLFTVSLFLNLKHVKY